MRDFDDMIYLKNLDPNKIKVDKKSYKITVIDHIGYVTVKGVSYGIIISVNPWYLITDKINVYTEENNGIFLTDEIKDILKKMKSCGVNQRLLYIKN